VTTVQVLTSMVFVVWISSDTAALYDSVITGRIVPAVSHMDQSILDDENASIDREAEAASATVAAEAKAAGEVIGEETWAPEKFVDAVHDRKTRGGIDRPGAIFFIPDRDPALADEAAGDGHVLWIFRPSRGADLAYQGVVATRLRLADPAAAAAALRDRKLALDSVTDQHQAKLADLQLALGKMRVFVDRTLDMIEQIRAEQRESRLRRVEIIGVVLGLLSLAGIGAMGVSLALLSRRIRNTGKAMETVARDNKSEAALSAIRIADTERIDEIGMLARGVAMTKMAFIDVINLERQKDRLDAEAATARRAAIVAMADAVERELVRAVGEIERGTNDVCERAGKLEALSTTVGDASAVVSGAARTAYDNAQAVAGATAQLSESFGEVGLKIAGAKSVVDNTVAAGTETIAAIGALCDSVNRIGSIADLISNIARQTGMLALNASIEAARAGEFGKGFSVVAGEVKTLARQTSEATQDINAQIEGIRKASATASSVVHRMEENLSRIDSATATITTVVERQADATRDISGIVAGTAVAANTVSERIAAVSAHAADAGSQSIAVRGAVETLSGSIMEMRDAMVRAVRTSTDDLNRRTSTRHPVERAATVSGNSGHWHTINLSKGGAELVAEEGHGFHLGDRLNVAIDDIPTEVPFVVVATRDNFVHLRIEADPAKAAQWSAAVDALAAEPGDEGRNASAG
jgi:methyl-accepting chemotaxis protein